MTEALSDEIIAATWFDDRCYKITKDGVVNYVASVTTKLGIEEKTFLLKWYADLGWDEARRQLHESGERGKRIHYALWVYLQGGTVIYNPWQSPFYSKEDVERLRQENNGLFFDFKNQDEMVALWKLQQFFERVKPKVVASEETVFWLEEGIAGTLDLAIHIDAGVYDVSRKDGLVIKEKGIYICDLKTGKMVSDSAWAQVAAYSRAWANMKKVQPKGAIILHTSATTKNGIRDFSAEMRTYQELETDYKIFKNLSYVWEQRNPGFGPKVFSFPTMIKKSQEAA